MLSIAIRGKDDSYNECGFEPMIAVVTYKDTQKMLAEPKLTVEQIRNALLETGGLRTFAAKRLGCRLRTIDKAIEDHDTLKETMYEISEYFLDLAEATILYHLEKGNLTVLRWYADFKLRDRGSGKTDRQNIQPQYPKPEIVFKHAHSPDQPSRVQTDKPPLHIVAAE